MLKTAVAFTAALAVVSSLACQTTAPSESSTATAGDGEGELVFRAKVSTLGLQTSSLAQGKGPDDTAEVILPGRLYEPPLAVEKVSREQVDRSTPVKAAASDYSAFKADDAAWILENFVEEEQAQIKTMLDDEQMRQRNKRVFDGRQSMEIWAEAEHNGKALLFVRYDGASERGAVLTFEQTQDGWKRTNALSADETFDVVFSAFRAGGEIARR